MTYPILYERNQYIHQIYDVKTPKKKKKQIKLQISL